MDMQGMPMDEMHNTFWREDQAVVTFHSATPLYSSDGVNQGGAILANLDLETQRQSLNTFLANNGVNYTLHFYHPDEEEDDDSHKSRPMQERGSSSSHAAHEDKQGFTPPPGVYLFGLEEPIQTPFGEVATSIVTFFDVTPKGGGNQAVVDIVNTFNQGLETLNNGSGNPDNGPVILGEMLKFIQPKPVPPVPISSSAPNWLWGGTGFIPQGCPLTPPIPVDDGCSYWHFHLPMLSPDELHSMKGEGVTMFVLDTLPDSEVIEHAAARAGDDNLLLFDVSRNVTFNYDIWNRWIADGGDPMIPELAVGKDVYGRHFGFKMPDHGLFIAGIVHDIAPHAKVECIRIMGEFCVGDSNLFLRGLSYIHNRMQQDGDLYQRPVVINLSNVMPTLEEAQSAGLDTSGAVSAAVLGSVHDHMLALVQLGALFVASAGNEADLRENMSGIRPPALHPAAFADSPELTGGVIPVGAVNKDSNATSYSCYPGVKGIATYGGEVPSVDPANPPSNDPVVTVDDAVRGIYSATHYPPLSEDKPALEYKAPNQRGWAYWIGTSFSTPIISAVAARVLELQQKGGLIGSVRNAIIGAGGSAQTTWNNLDASGTSAPGPMIIAVQECQVKDEGDDD